MFPYKTRENKGSPSCLYLHVVTIHKYTCNLSPVPELSSTCGNATEAPCPSHCPLPQEQGRGAPPCDFIFTQGLSWSYEPSRPLKVGDEHHEVLQGPRMFLKVTLGPAPSSAMFRAQRGMVSHKPCLCLRPLRAGGSSTRSQACSGGRQGPGRARCPASVRFSPKRCLRPNPLGLCFSEPTQTL